jgi:hypothetical protein
MTRIELAIVRSPAANEGDVRRKLAVAATQGPGPAFSALVLSAVRDLRRMAVSVANAA